MKAMIWQCPECKDVRVSYSREVHCMNLCKCEASGVDMEDLYTRFLGYVQVLNEFDDTEYPFILEMHLNCLVQGYGYFDNENITDKIRDEQYIEIYSTK